MRLLQGRTEKAHSKAYQRLSRLPTDDVMNWADQAGSGVSAALLDYRKYRTAESLQEARTGLEALLAVVEVLEDRER